MSGIAAPDLPAGGLSPEAEDSVLPAPQVPERRRGDRRVSSVPVVVERRVGERRVYSPAEVEEVAHGIAEHLELEAARHLSAKERNELVEQAMPLVRNILASVSSNFPRHADREELGQAAMLGLVEAAHRFDPTRGVPFERWVALRIRGSILDAARGLDFASRSVRASARALERATVELQASLGRTPSHAEIAQHMGVGLREVDQLRARLHGALVLSLDAPSPDEDEECLTLGAGVVDPSQPDPLCELETREHTAYIRAAVELLPERLRDVVCSYFLAGETSAELAARLRIPESRVSQLRSEALALIRTAVMEQYAEELGVLTPRSAAHAAALAETPFAERITRAARVAGP